MGISIRLSIEILITQYVVIGRYLFVSKISDKVKFWNKVQVRSISRITHCWNQIRHFRIMLCSLSIKAQSSQWSIGCCLHVGQISEISLLTLPWLLQDRASCAMSTSLLRNSSAKTLPMRPRWYRTISQMLCIRSALPHKTQDTVAGNSNLPSQRQLHLSINMVYFKNKVRSRKFV